MGKAAVVKAVVTVVGMARAGSGSKGGGGRCGGLGGG